MLDISQTGAPSGSSSWTLHAGAAAILGEKGYEIQFGILVVLGNDPDIALFLTKAPAARGSSGIAFPPKSLRAALTGEVLFGAGNLSTDQFRSPNIEAVSFNIPPMPVLPYGAGAEGLYDGGQLRHAAGGVAAGFAATVTGPRNGLIRGSGVYGIRDAFADVFFPIGDSINDAYWNLDDYLRGN